MMTLPDLSGVFVPSQWFIDIAILHATIFLIVYSRHTDPFIINIVPYLTETAKSGCQVFLRHSRVVVVAVVVFIRNCLFPHAEFKTSIYCINFWIACLFFYTDTNRPTCVILLNYDIRNRGHERPKKIGTQNISQKSNNVLLFNVRCVNHSVQSTAMLHNG